MGWAVEGACEAHSAVYDDATVSFIGRLSRAKTLDITRSQQDAKYS